MAEHFRSIAQHHLSERAAVQIAGVLVDGEHAVVLGTLDNTLAHNDARYRAHFALHLTVENGLITRHHVYEDSLSVASAWGLADG